MVINQDQSKAFLLVSKWAAVYAMKLSDYSVDKVYRNVDPSSDENPSLLQLSAGAMASDNQHLYLVETAYGRLIKMDTSTGLRQTLIGSNHDTERSWFENGQGLVVDKDKQLLYGANSDKDVLLLMDETSNEWVLIAE